MIIEEQNGIMTNLKEALPKEFSFYHLGSVEMRSQREFTETNAELILEDLNAVAFSFQGDFRGVLIILVEKGLDVSIYSELGNILASRLATELTHDGYDVMITPPRLLQAPQLERLIQTPQKKIHGKYQHLYQNTTVPVETVLIPFPDEQVGYA